VSRTLEEALALAGRGWATLPIEPGARGGKEPNFRVLERVYSTTTWSLLAQRPACSAEIRGWFEADPDANVGVILGQASGGLVVADVDRPRIAAQKLRHPPTPVAKTRRGFHAYFRAHRPTATTGTSWGELRGDGSYVVAPPSTHRSGHNYHWLVPPGEAALADLEHVHGEGLVGEPSPEAGPAGAEATFAGGDVSSLAGLDGAVQAALETMGVQGALGRKFSCVLPGHGPDHHPSAAMHRGPDGVWRYMDFHRPSDPHSLTLAEVRASRGAGKIERLRGPSQARWYWRLFWEAGLIAVHQPPLPVPRQGRGTSALSEEAVKVGEGFMLLQALRDLSDGGPTPYTTRFASGWCSISKDSAWKSIGELLEAGVLVKVGRHRRMNLYEPGRGPA